MLIQKLHEVAGVFFWTYVGTGHGGIYPDLVA